MSERNICVNRKANFSYFLEEKIECGLQLLGVEIKSVFASHCNLKEDCFCRVENGEVFAYGFHIQPYHNADAFLKEEPDRPKKLLLHKKEIVKLSQVINQDGLTLIPTRVYFVNGRAKMEIAIAKGKHLYDKRKTIAERENKRTIERELKNRF